MSDVTLNGLESWHRCLVEKFGWTVIAVEKGHTQKGENFLLCLENLINSIQLRLDDGIQSIDSHKDLEILDIAQFSPAGSTGVNPDGSLQLWTHEDGSDSMFMALLQKSSDPLN